MIWTMSINLKTLLKRDSLFMCCFATAVALGWVSVLVSDYWPPHAAPFRHGMHWMLAVSTSLLVVVGWAEPRRPKLPPCHAGISGCERKL